MKQSGLLMADAAINLILGILLLFFPPELVWLLVIPAVEQVFYPSILGAVLFGIGIALLVEYFRRAEGMVGLGLGGATGINLCGGLVLAGWLVSGKLTVPLRGYVVLWFLVLILVGISAIEFRAYSMQRRT